MADEKQVAVLVSILIVDDDERVHICSWLSDELLGLLTDAERERLTRTMHEFCLELRPVLMRATPPKLND